MYWHCCQYFLVMCIDYSCCCIRPELLWSHFCWLFHSLSLHAHLRDTVTCTIIANIWLKNPANLLVSGYQSLAEMYVVKVLCSCRRWDDVRPFLDSCPGLSASVRDSMAQQVAAYRYKLEEAEVNCIEVLESHNDSQNTDHWTDSSFCQIHTVNGNSYSF